MIHLLGAGCGAREKVAGPRGRAKFSEGTSKDKEYKGLLRHEP